MASENDFSAQRVQEYILVWNTTPPARYEEIQYRSPNFTPSWDVNYDSDMYIELKLRREKGSDFDIATVDVICDAPVLVVKSIYFLNNDNEVIMHINRKDNIKIKSDILAKGKFVVKLHMECQSFPASPSIWLEGKTVVSQTSLKSLILKNGSNTFEVMLNNTEIPITITKNNTILFIEVLQIPRLLGIISVLCNFFNHGEINSCLIDKDGETSYKYSSLLDIYKYNYTQFVLMENDVISKISTSIETKTKQYEEHTSHTELAKLQPFIAQHFIAKNNVLHKLYADQKLCDITIQGCDTKIRAHKIALATVSTVWHELFISDETIDVVHIADFDNGTIMDLMEYIYTGIVPQPLKSNNEQLFLIACKFDIIGLKERCEILLIETISMNTAARLAILAHQWKTSTLLDNVFSYIRTNFAVFKERKEFESLFFAYPELAFKLMKLL